jgi:succinate dehydrogenase / fumarate reductase flavoprotein subunit
LIDVIVVEQGLAGASASAILAELVIMSNLLLSRFSETRALYRCPRRDQCRKKLSRRRRFNLSFVFTIPSKKVTTVHEKPMFTDWPKCPPISLTSVLPKGFLCSDYGGLLDNRSFGGVLVSRTFYAKGQTGQQLLLGAYSAMNRQIGRGKIKMYNRHEMMDVVVVDGKARGIITRNLVNGKIERHGAHAVVIASGGYGNVFFLSTNAMGSNVSAAWKIHKKGALLCQPLFYSNSPYLYSRFWRPPVQVDLDVGITSKRWTYLGA